VPGGIASSKVHGGGKSRAMESVVMKCAREGKGVEDNDGGGWSGQWKRLFT
jgi:hypothetical protein